MSKILDLYGSLNAKKHRFLDEIFTSEIYSYACPKLTIVDIGAYEGEFGYYCYNFADRIYAIEPDPEPFAKMAKNVEEFELTKFSLFPIAIAEKSGDRFLHASHNGGGAFTESIGDPSVDIKVRALSLKDFMSENSIDVIDILKVDAESAEYEILGSPEFAKVADRVRVIIGEDHKGGSLSTILEPLGFEFSLPDNCFLARRWRKVYA